METVRLTESTDILDDASALCDRAASDGYIFLRGLIDVETIRALGEAILPFVLEDSAFAQPRIHMLAEFQALRADDRIRGVLARIFGSAPLGGYGDVCRMVAPNAPATAPHQDHFYIKRSTNLWTVWIPLTDCPASLGGLAVIPGSHREGLRPHDRESPTGRAIDVSSDARWASASYREGDVLMFNALTIHAARPNTTVDQVRLSVDFRYVPS